MLISERFQQQPWFHRLEKRKWTFLKMIEHLEAIPEGGRILETGTLRITDNFEGDGQSTFIWNWFLSQEDLNDYWLAYSVDIDPNAVKIATEHCPLVKIRESDSLKFLSDYAELLDPTMVRLLYLDSFDWHPDIHLDSCFHHLAELTTIYAKLPSGCMIVVDDKHGPLAGKHMMVQFFFEKLGITPVFDAYQVGWIKP